MKQEDNYRMQRRIVTGTSIEEADDHVTYWLDKTPLERLNAACFIINNLFSVTAATGVKKDIVVSRKHNNG
jgi:hypothetical protein